MTVRAGRTSPPSSTVRFAYSGRYFDTGSSSRTAPRSISCMPATIVNSLVAE